MKPEIIIMLTHHDKTHPECEDIFNACKDLPVQHWGFKNVDQPIGVMKSCAAAMKAAGKTTYLEVVTYDEESCLAGAQTAIDCGFDCLCGTIYYESVHKKLADAGVEYLPFVGKVHGSPSVLEGTNEEIIAEAKANAKAIAAEAEQQIAVATAAAEEIVGDAEKKLEELKVATEAYKAQIKAMIEAQQKLIAE